MPGSRPASFGFAKRVYIAIDDDGARARTADKRRRLERIYGRRTPGIEAAAVTGTPDGLRPPRCAPWPTQARN